MFLWKNVYIKRTSRFLDQPVSFIKVNESQYKQCGVTSPRENQAIFQKFSELQSFRALPTAVPVTALFNVIIIFLLGSFYHMIFLEIIIGVNECVAFSTFSSSSSCIKCVCEECHAVLCKYQHCLMGPSAFTKIFSIDPEKPSLTLTNYL